MLNFSYFSQTMAVRSTNQLYYEIRKKGSSFPLKDNTTFNTNIFHTNISQLQFLVVHSVCYGNAGHVLVRIPSSISCRVLSWLLWVAWVPECGKRSHGGWSWSSQSQPSNRGPNNLSTKFNVMMFQSKHCSFEVFNFLKMKKTVTTLYCNQFDGIKRPFWIPTQRVNTVDMKFFAVDKFFRGARWRK